MTREKTLTVSVMPTYQCNGNCPFCYLGTSIKDKTILNLDVLHDRLWNIKKRYQCNLNVEVFGGEITLLEDDYIDQLLKLCNQYSVFDVGVVTNFSKPDVVKKMIDRGVPVAVSWNKERGKVGKQCLENLASLESDYSRRINLLVVCLPSTIKQKPTDFLDLVESYKIKSLSILQYYPAVQSKKHYSVNNADYQQYMIDVIEAYKQGNYSFELANINQWKSRYDCKQSSNIFINPYGQYAVTKYDENAMEYFHNFDSLQQYDDICMNEMTKYINSCIMCTKFNKCLAEHLRFDKQEVCCGLPSLTDYINTL